MYASDSIFGNVCVSVCVSVVRSFCSWMNKYIDSNYLFKSRQLVNLGRNFTRPI